MGCGGLCGCVEEARALQAFRVLSQIGGRCLRLFFKLTPWKSYCCLSKPSLAMASEQFGFVVQISCISSVVSDSLWPHGLQHTRLSCPSPSPKTCSSSCPLSQWYHPTISFFIALFSSCPQSFPVSGSFPMSWLFASNGQGVGASTSASVLPKTIQGWIFRIDWFILLAVQGTLKSLLWHHSLKVSVL